jgi:uncharacterized protein YPO0396
MRNRYLCDVLEEMRKAHETRNFSYLPGLIEEAQHMGNRMEAALEDKDDLTRYARKVSELKEEKRELKAVVDSLKKERKALIRESKSKTEAYKKTGQMVDEDI